MQCLKVCRETKSDNISFWERKLEQIFVPDTVKYANESAVVALSVRSTLDLYFQSRQFPKGSEIIMTGINIGDMIKIIEEHGLVPIPVDLDPYTMAPQLS